MKSIRQINVTITNRLFWILNSSLAVISSALFRIIRTYKKQSLRANGAEASRTGSTGRKQHLTRKITPRNFQQTLLSPDGRSSVKGAR